MKYRATPQPKTVGSEMSIFDLLLRHLLSQSFLILHSKVLNSKYRAEETLSMIFCIVLDTMKVYLLSNY